MQKNIVTEIAVVVVLLVGGVVWYFTSTPNSGDGKDEVRIDARYDEKLVYTADTSLDPGPFAVHCENERGTFNPCGTPCAPDADMCATVCAYTCDLAGDISGTPSDTGTWSSYTNDTYHFTLQYPADDWNVEEDVSFEFSPKYNFYEKPAGVPVSLPLTHHANMTHASVYPLGIPTEGVFGTAVPLGFSVPYANMDESKMYLLEDGTPFAAMIVPESRPASWNDSGFVWVRAFIEGYETECVRNGAVVGADTCDPLTRDDEIVHTGVVDIVAWERAVAVAQSLSFVEDTDNSVDASAMIRLDVPSEGATIASPLTVQGEARGTWYFEADFPVVLTDWDGRIIAETSAQADGAWMTEDFVSFSAELTFESPYSEGDPDYMRRGSLIVQKANPSGLPENDAAHEIVVNFAPAS